MNKVLSNVIMFTIGAAIGSVVTWKVVKTKYEQVAQEEIDSVKEEYEKLSDRRRKEMEVYKRFNEANHAYEDNSAEEEDTSDEEMIEYHNLTKKYRTSTAESEKNDEKGGKENYVEMPVQYINGPYVISPDMLNDMPGYNSQALTYFVDGILADDWGVELDIEETIGEDSLKHFGEYVDDTVYVRNERTEIDYEVTQDPRTYEDAMKARPSSYYD